MAIVKHEIPILEYDDSCTSVIMPTHEKLALHLPERAVFAFLGSRIDRFAEQRAAQCVGEFVSITKKYPIYMLEHEGKKICLCQAPVGAAAATQILDWLIGYGVKKVIAVGSCGALLKLPENTFMIPVKALRDEGTSYHYLPPSRYVELNRRVRQSMEQTLERKRFLYKECITWTTDGFYRETKEKVNYRKEEGCSVVEMECAALAACAQFRGAEFGQLLFTADTLENVDDYDERTWGKEAHQVALETSLGLAAEL